MHCMHASLHVCRRACAHPLRARLPGEVGHSALQKRADETSGLLSTRRISVRVVLLCLNNNVELRNMPWQRVQGEVGA